MPTQGPSHAYADLGLWLFLGGSCYLHGLRGLGNIGEKQTLLQKEFPRIHKVGRSKVKNSKNKKQCSADSAEVDLICQVTSQLLRNHRTKTKKWQAKEERDQDRNPSKVCEKNAKFTTSKQPKHVKNLLKNNCPIENPHCILEPSLKRTDYLKAQSCHENARWRPRVFTAEAPVEFQQVTFGTPLGHPEPRIRSQTR